MLRAGDVMRCGVAMLLLCGIAGCAERKPAEQAQLPARVVSFKVDEPGLLYTFEDISKGRVAAQRLAQVPAHRRASLMVKRAGWPEIDEPGAAYVADLSDAAPGAQAKATLKARRYVISSGFACQWADERALGVVIMARGLADSAPWGARERRAQELLRRFDDLVPSP